MVTLQNNTKATYVHNELTLNPTEVLEVPENVAKIWLGIDGIVEYVDPAEAKAKEAELVEENAKLKAEIEKLKAEAKAKEADTGKTLEELKAEADSLGIEYAKKIGAKALQEKINAKKAE